MVEPWCASLQLPALPQLLCPLAPPLVLLPPVQVLLPLELPLAVQVLLLCCHRPVHEANQIRVHRAASVHAEILSRPLYAIRQQSHTCYRRKPK